MGMVQEYVCPDCGYHLELLTGAGMLMGTINPNHIDKHDESSGWSHFIESEEMLDEVEEILNLKHGHMDTCGNEIYYSESDKTLCIRFYFELYYPENNQIKVYTPKYYDTNNKELVKVSEDDVAQLDLECPKCKSKAFGKGELSPDETRITMCWD